VRLLVLGAFCALAACSARAQPGRRSQRGTVTQLVNGTEISIRYYRPVLRGRIPFPDVVNWGRTSTPGADSATRIEISGPVEFEGQPLPAGRYSLWVVPKQNEAWSVIFNKEAEAFHLSHDESQDALTLHIRPDTAATAVETLQLSFPLVDADSALLQLQWGTVVLPIHLRAR
jgi:hypothetical protein